MKVIITYDSETKKTITDYLLTNNEVDQALFRVMKNSAYHIHRGIKANFIKYEQYFGVLRDDKTYFTVYKKMTLKRKTVKLSPQEYIMYKEIQGYLCYLIDSCNHGNHKS